jgi:hypothetical protein
VTTSASHVEIYLSGVKQSSGYSVGLNANQASSPGGTVTFTVAPANGAAIRIQRLVPVTQETVLPSYGQFRAKDVEKGLDRLAYQAQQIDRYARDLAIGSPVAGASYLMLSLDPTLTNERVLVGTANQVILTDSGPNGNLTLSLAPTLSVWQRAVATADTSNSVAATGADVVGLSFAVASGKKYLVRAVLFAYAAAATTGMGVGAKATGAPTTSAQFFNFRHRVTANADDLFSRDNFEDLPPTTLNTYRTVSTFPQLDNFDGYFVATGAGTFQLRLTTEVDSSAVTVKAGSYLEWMEF